MNWAANSAATAMLRATDVRPEVVRATAQYPF